MTLLKVNEIFYSIQGESSYAGSPCVFIRLSGCNLRCTYCDTRYAYEDGDMMDLSEIAEKAASYGCSLVEITGGEPLVQEGTPLLISDLIEKGFCVLLETNGTQNIGKTDPRCVRILDIKCPGSGEHEKNDFGNLERITDRDEIKFVIGGRKDYEYALQISRRIRARAANQVHFSPVYGKLHPCLLAQWMLADHAEAKLHLQLHKYIWPPEQRGV
ncbi:MAG: radical SAM protein [Desulfococcaceae bacterium]